MKRTYRIDGDPRSKKNSQRIITLKGRPCIIPSKQFKDYEKIALEQLRLQNNLTLPINEPCNVKCIYYMETKRKVDLVNLQEATLDILVKAKILDDDNCSIVNSMDGSLVSLGVGKGNGYVNIEIETYGGTK